MTDFPLNPLSGFHNLPTSSPPFIDNLEDKSFHVANADFMIGVEPAPISCGHVVKAITQLPPSLIQNCDDYLVALSQLSSNVNTLDLSVNQHIIVSGRDIQSTAAQTFFEAELPMVGPLQYSESSPPQSNYLPAIAPPSFSSHQLVHKTNQRHSGGIMTTTLQQRQMKYESFKVMNSPTSSLSSNFHHQGLPLQVPSPLGLLERF